MRDGFPKGSITVGIARNEARGRNLRPGSSRKRQTMCTKVEQIQIPCLRFKAYLKRSIVILTPRSPKKRARIAEH